MNQVLLPLQPHRESQWSSRLSIPPSSAQALWPLGERTIRWEISLFFVSVSPLSVALIAMQLKKSFFWNLNISLIRWRIPCTRFHKLFKDTLSCLQMKVIFAPVHLYLSLQFLQLLLCEAFLAEASYIYCFCGFLAQGQIILFVATSLLSCWD